MKRLILLCLSIYRVLLSPLLHQLSGGMAGCRFEVTCSRYAQQVIQKYGIIKGLKLTLIRLSQCQPFAKQYGKYL
jgi:putative component of membrane protein insertase Oxa1/YidC/SpoIIIJ protein YidD